MLLAVDTETTGVDFYHGTKPYIITTCDSKGNQITWEWDVDPLTREPNIPEEDLLEVKELLENNDLIFQNSLFDIKAINTIVQIDWDYSRIHDTLFAAHLINSSERHDLTSLCVKYLGYNPAKFEKNIQTITNKARRLARKHFPDWRIAVKGAEDMPSNKGEPWKADMWLPRALHKVRPDLTTEEYETRCLDYANTDSACTFALHEVQQKLINERGHDKLYTYSLKRIPIILSMEDRGITANKTRLDTLELEYMLEASKGRKICSKIAKDYGYYLALPKSGNNQDLLNFVFDVLELDPVSKSKKTGNPSLDKAAIDYYENTLEEGGKPLEFIKTLKEVRQRSTALNYIEGYRRFWLPLKTTLMRKHEDWFRLHPSLNPTGTSTLRWSSKNPNEQNISKKEGFNLRYCFGPAPEREWWSLDANNIELRIPAYESGEQAMIDIFDRPNDPPFYGSYHLLIFSLLYPDLWKKYEAGVKKKFVSSNYGWAKNFNFADQYGAGSKTADAAAHLSGAQQMVNKQLKAKAELNKKYVSLANKNGYVETIPDKTVDPDRGYPIYCQRTNWGKVKPTQPLNYHVQSTAMQWMTKAMIRCDEYLKEVNYKHSFLEDTDKNGYYMIMQVHDELVFDFPKGSNQEPWKTNLPIIKRIKELMEEGGNDIGIPTPVSVEYHQTHWGESIEVEV